jgi:GNAT superfamily N-acetyltransferase
LRFVVGCDLEEFKRYYKTLEDLHNYYKTLGLHDVKAGELGGAEEYWVTKRPSHLIVWRENDEIIGHTIWHPSNIDEHRKGAPRDQEDKELLRKLLGGKKDFVELHEIWLQKKHRGKGYGKEFFEFFEEFIRNRNYDSIVYYTNHPAAVVICRKRRYKEAFLAKDNWYVFHLLLSSK